MLYLHNYLETQKFICNKTHKFICNKSICQISYFPFFKFVAGLKFIFLFHKYVKWDVNSINVHYHLHLLLFIFLNCHLWDFNSNSNIYKGPIILLKILDLGLVYIFSVPSRPIKVSYLTSIADY